jgi:membrane protease YdiL (CAAX protease family)
VAATARTEKNPSFDGSVITTTLIFIAVILLVPFVMDYFVKLAVAVGLATSVTPWVDALIYFFVYTIMLFYMLTSFEPLNTYGYRWNNQYIWWAVYIGVGSGVVMFAVDKFSHLAEAARVPAFSTGVVLSYMLAWVVLPALMEETLFRGVIQRYYQKKLNTTVTSHNIHVAVFFGVAAELLFHLSIPLYYGMSTGNLGAAALSALPQLIYVAVFGFISGVFYQRTNSLLGPILIHALGNGTELVLLWVF